MSYTRRVLRGIAIVLSFSVLASLLGYALRLYLARALEPSDFGLVYSILGLFGFIMFFVYFGFLESTVKFVADFHARRKEARAIEAANTVLWTELCLAAVVTVVFLSIADVLAANYFKSAAAALPFKIYLLGVLIMPFEALIVKLFQAYQRPMYYSLVQFFRTAVLLVLTLALFTFFPDLGVLAAIIPYPITTLALVLFWYPLFKRNVFSKFRISPKLFDAKLLKKIFMYGVPIALTVLSQSILMNTDTVMITAFRELEEVGLYHAALPVANILIFFGTSVITVFFPLAAELWAKKKKALLQSVMSEAYVLLLAAIVPAAVLFIVFSDIILNILFGGKFMPAAPALEVLAISSVFATISMFNGSILSGIGRPQLMTKAVIVGSVFNVIVNFLLIPKIGFVGAAYATLIAQFFIFMANTYYVRKNIHFSFPFHKLLLIILAGGILVPLVTFLRETVQLPLIPKLLIVCLALLIVYPVMLLLFRVIRIQRIKTLVAEFMG